MFDEVRAEHEGMAAEVLNDDDVCKSIINQVNGGVEEGSDTRVSATKHVDEVTDAVPRGDQPGHQGGRVNTVHSLMRWMPGLHGVRPQQCNPTA